MFYLICEGGIHTVAYLHNNNIYPDRVIFDPRKVKDYIPYLDEKDDILILIHGLTEWTIVEIYSLMNDLKDVTRVGDITIVSDIDFKKMPMNYNLYSGDVVTATGKVKDAKGKVGEVRLLEAYFKYNSIKLKPIIVEREAVVEEVSEVVEKRMKDYDELSQRIVRILPKIRKNN